MQSQNCTYMFGIINLVLWVDGFGHTLTVGTSVYSTLLFVFVSFLVWCFALLLFVEKVKLVFVACLLHAGLSRTVVLHF